MGLDFVPGVGTFKSLVEAISGKDYVTGAELIKLERWLSAFGAVAPGVKAAVGLIKGGGKGLAKLGTVASKGGDILPTKKANPIGSTKHVGEEFLDATIPGESQVFRSTSQGSRFIDRLEIPGDIAHESKVGYQTLTRGNQRQILKDAELMREKRIQGSKWHFFESPATGKQGPSKQLRNFLEQHNIPYHLHKP